MIVVKLMGGLGNQMFQIAFARSMAISNKQKVILDLSAYEKYKIRKFAASNLFIGDNLDYIENFRIPYFKRKIIQYSYSFYRAFQRIIRIGKKKKVGKTTYKLLSRWGFYYNFDRFHYEVPTVNNKNKYLYGYFQSNKYFKAHETIIKKEFKVKTTPTNSEQILLSDIKKSNSVAVSVRLGDDYLKSEALNVCNPKYFYDAMDTIYENNKDVVFFIFSDDIERAKDIFEFKYPVQYIEGFNDYQSLRLMYTCEHFIVSNSSFSWWGAYLGENPSKIIISPDRWYNNEFEKPDIFYEELTLIEVE